jgi:hypothetical protein
MLELVDDPRASAAAAILLLVAPGTLSILWLNRLP